MRQNFCESVSDPWSRCNLQAICCALALAATVIGAASAGAAPLTVKDLAISTAAEKDPGSTEAMDAALNEINKQSPDLALALKLFEDAVQKDPRWPPARVLMAKSFLLRGSVPAAQDQLEQLTKNHPEEPEAYLLLGEMAYGLRRITEAKLLFEEGGRRMADFKGDPSRKKNLDERVQAGLASVAEAREQFDVAISHMEEWIKINPDSHAAHQRLGAALFRQNPKDDAARKAAYVEFQKASKLNADISTPDILLMQLCEQAGDRKYADTMAKRAIKNSPDNFRVQLDVAQWMVNTNQIAEAKPHAERALQLNPDAVEAKVLRGIVARYLHELDEAEQLLNDARNQEPNAFNINDQLALVLIESSDTAKQNRALNLAQENLNRNNQSVDAALTMGWILFKQGKSPDAERLLAQAISATQRIPPDGAYYWAKVSLERGRKPDAVSALEKALESPLPFYYRQEAEALRNSLAKK